MRLNFLQIGVYDKVRKAEAESEKNKRKNEAKNVGKNSEDKEDISLTIKGNCHK